MEQAADGGGIGQVETNDLIFLLDAVIILNICQTWTKHQNIYIFLTTNYKKIGYIGEWWTPLQNFK